MLERAKLMLGLLLAASCARAVAAPEEIADLVPAAAPGAARAEVLDRLGRLNRSGQFLFGQEHATLWGMWLDGGLVSTGKWFEGTARAGRFTSDSAMLVGDDPAVLGVSLGMLAFEPTSWNRRAVIAEAIRRQFAQGGLVTMDWHVPSCNADARPAETLGKVRVGGRDVDVFALTGGASFYAEEEYTRPIASRADVPATLECLCQVANDLPLSAGAYKGTPGRTWLVAQAKYAAQVMREEHLTGLPIIVRPFHEHTGSWFWWGQPYWNCKALLDRADAVTGPDAFKGMTRTFVEALRAEPGMGELLFAYSPDKLTGRDDEERFSPAQQKVQDPTGVARDMLRKRLTGELAAAGLGYASPAERAAKTHAARATSAKAAGAYVAERRRFYAEAYAGDDVFDVLGIDLYHPVARAANAADLRLYRLQLRVLADEARARGKPYALTEAGTYRLGLSALAGQAAPGQPITVNGKPEVDAALARLFDPADRTALLRHFGLAASGPVVLGAAERAAVVPRLPEDWFNRQLLPLAREAKVAYALVWQTYYDPAAKDHYAYYYVPYPGHPEAQSFKWFYGDPATCFLRDACGVAPAPPAPAPAVAGTLVMASAPAAATPAAPAGDAPTPEAYRKLADAAEALLRRDVLDVWFPRSVDGANGGFHASFARDWRPTPDSAGRFSVFQARMTWLASEIAVQRPDLRDRFLPIARHGFAYLRDVLWDKQAGGFFWGLDEHGKVSPMYTDGKHVYGNAFCLYALAAYYRATRDPEAIALAQRAFRWLDEHAHDARNGGYFEWLGRDGRPVPARVADGGKVDLVPIAGFPVGYKSMNTHLHVLEALSELSEVWKDATVQARLAEVLGVLRDKVCAPPGVMSLYFTNDWVALPDHDSYGHDVEAAYLMLEAEDALGRGHAAATERMARMLVDHALAYGWDARQGGFYRHGTITGPAEDRQKEWWVELEGLNALLMMHERYGATTDAYWKAFLRQWRFVTERQLDDEHRGFHETLDADGRPVPGVKGRIWKEAYHEGRAMLNVVARLRRLAGAPAANGAAAERAPR
jgi:mannose/cellobiose epimerase-like protein (N-acyl-D-glucosamine 2-epimerase family)